MYWIAGLFAALSVLLEKKNRRAELALYVLPRAADSLWYILVHRRLLPQIRHAEVSGKWVITGVILQVWQAEMMVHGE